MWQGVDGTALMLVLNGAIRESCRKLKMVIKVIEPIASMIEFDQVLHLVVPLVLASQEHHFT